MARHRTTIALIILAALCAALLTVVIRVATNDQFQTWVKTRPWYTPQRAWFAAAILLIAVIAIGILQYLVAHHSKQTSMRLVAGVCDPDDYASLPKSMKSATESSLLYLLGVPEGSVTIVHCMLRLINTSERAIKGVRLQLEYPKSYLVEDQVAVVLENKSFVKMKSAEPHFQDVKRQAVVIQDVVRASFNMELLRYDETVVISEPLIIRRMTAAELQRPSRFRPSALTTRLSRNANFLDYLRLIACVFSEESKLETAIDIFAFSGSDTDDACMAKDAIEDAVWNGRAPQPGETYVFTDPRGRLTSHLEMSVPKLRAELPGHLYQEIPFEWKHLGMSWLLLPREDFRDSHAQHSFGLRIRRGRKGPRGVYFAYYKPKPPSA